LQLGILTIIFKKIREIREIRGSSLWFLCAVGFKTTARSGEMLSPSLMDDLQGIISSQREEFRNRESGESGEFFGSFVV
jgi:hypothetical protein